MINTLFSMHNIKYIISVDDCFFTRKREEMEAAVYSEMCTSLDSFRTILSSSNQAGEADAISEMLEIGSDASTLIQSLVESLEIENLQKCYEICEENGCVLIQAHPFPEYCQIQNPKYLHGVERNFNSGHDNHNEKLDAWLKEPGREHLIITRGSDCHEIPQVGLVDFVIDEDVKNSTELAQVLKKLV